MNPTENKSTGECECEFCKECRRVDEIVARRDVDELISLIRRQQDEIVEIGHDNCWYSAISDGSWPDSVDILEQWLAKARERGRCGGDGEA